MSPGGTGQSGRRDRCRPELAQLRHASADALPMTRVKRAALSSTHVWINRQRVRAGHPPIRLFESQQHLVAELEMALEDGRKCFVTSNSKSLVEKLAAGLGSRFGANLRVLLITSNTVSSEEA